jgi:hypothetical protein
MVMSSVEVHVPSIRNGRKIKKEVKPRTAPKATPSPITVPPPKKLLMLAANLFVPPV